MNILGIDIGKLLPEHSLTYTPEYKIESLKLVKMFFAYPQIYRALNTYLKTGKSRLEFLTNYSEEQIKYITNPNICDIKVMACPGSGKTRSIIGRVKFLVEHRIVPKENIFAITFAKLAATDYHQRIASLFPDYENFCELSNFSTIDSLAKSFLSRVKTHKSENVEILSIAFRNYLRIITSKEIKSMRFFKNIKYLFVDEAQDLNETRYDILMLLKNKFGTIIELIGDPNQNIYQFSGSSSTYLINFPATTFNFTHNFRSTQEIIDFSEYLKPHPTTKSISAHNKKGSKVILITRPMQDMHQLMLRFINSYKQKFDISNIAIICPTRGLKTKENMGLAVLFNFLKANKIPFNQMYDESGQSRDNKRHVKKLDGHLNLLTYHGTKGLEFDVVFVMDCYQNLMGIKPTKEEHDRNRYLLYVATTRAISKMFICVYSNCQSGYWNSWMENIPKSLYQTDIPINIPQLTFREPDSDPPINGITELISNMTAEQLNMIDDILKIKEGDNMFTKRIYSSFAQIDRGTDEILFGLFIEELFYLQYTLSRKIHPRELKLIKDIIEAKMIVVSNDSEYKQLKTHIVKPKLTWNIYDKMICGIPEHVKHLVSKYYQRDRPMEDHTICTNEFIKIVDANMTDIRDTYYKYLFPENYEWDYRKILKDLFYLYVVIYAYDNNHYYYVENHGNQKSKLLVTGCKLFDSMNKYVCNNYLNCTIQPKIPVCYHNLNIKGEIDFIEIYEGDSTIVEIKCAREISIKYYIQLLLYNFCYNYKKKDLDKKDLDKIYCNKFKILNLLTGLEHYLILSISPTNMFNLLITISQIGNLKFNDLNLVFDLETTDRINKVGPLKYKPTIDRGYFYKRDNGYVGEVLPEIIEIAIKDYDTGMILIDTLVKPSKPIRQIISDLTGVTNEMLRDVPVLSDVRKVLRQKMKNFANYRMMAHNGCGFDNKIVLYDKLVDKEIVTFLDTMSIIPIHLKDHLKLESKALGEIYKVLFDRQFKAHRAMSDVNALIKIMKYLKVNI